MATNIEIIRQGSRDFSDKQIISALIMSEDL